MNFIKSEQFFLSANSVIPGGVNSPVRSFRSVGGHPFVVSRGEGPFIWDIDGNKYIDLVSSWGALIHGHSHPYILERVLEASKKGLSFGITCELEYQLAKKICDSVSHIDKVRLVNSGTEACMSAVRLARGYTGRDLILKFDGHYHGHADFFLVGAGSGVAQMGVADSLGIPKHTTETTLVIPFNDLEATRKVFGQHGKNIACTILEVVPGNMGLVKPKPEFLKLLRELSDAHGSLLIFDEVMTGFRLSLEGAKGLFGIDPDLSCFGKVIGGGMPVGAFGGRAVIMDKIAPLGGVYQAGTLSGNPLSCAAGLASLELILETGNQFFQFLDSAGAELKSGIQSHISHYGYPVSIEQLGSMLTIFFRKATPNNFTEAKDINKERFNKFFWALLKRGVYYPPSAFESCFLSYAHKPEIMEQVEKACIDSLDEVFHGEKF